MGTSCGMRMFGVLVCICVLMLFGRDDCGQAQTLSLRPADFERVSMAGKDSLNKLQRLASLPGSDCWKAALEDLKVGCSDLDEEKQTILAFRFTTCFNIMTGRSKEICTSSVPIKECVKVLQSDDLQTFRDYFLQAQDLCFFVQNDLWHTRTETAVNKLTETSFEVMQDLAEARDAQKQVLESQQQSLKLQNSMMEGHDQLQGAVQNVKEVFDDFTESAKEHRMIFTDIFHRIATMQNLVTWIQGQISFVDFIGFYVIASVMGYIATATKRTIRCRFGLILLFIFCMWLERQYYNYLISLDVDPDTIQERLWLVRKSVSIVAILWVICQAALYRDANQTAMNAIQSEIRKLSILMESKNQLSETQQHAATSSGIMEMSDDDSETDYSNEEDDGSFSDEIDPDELDSLKQSPVVNRENNFAATTASRVREYNFRPRAPFGSNYSQNLPESVNSFVRNLPFVNNRNKSRAGARKNNRPSTAYFSDEDD